MARIPSWVWLWGSLDTATAKDDGSKFADVDVAAGASIGTIGTWIGTWIGTSIASTAPSYVPSC